MAINARETRERCGKTMTRCWGMNNVTQSYEIKMTEWLTRGTEQQVTRVHTHTRPHSHWAPALASPQLAARTTNESEATVYACNFYPLKFTALFIMLTFSSYTYSHLYHRLIDFIQMFLYIYALQTQVQRSCVLMDTTVHANHGHTHTHTPKPYLIAEGTIK